jgi:hypothetical protein
MTLQAVLPPADPTLKTTQTTEVMLPPPLPIDSQGEAAFSTETGKGKAAVKRKGNAQGGDDDESGDGESDDDCTDPSYKDKYDLSARSIAQQVNRHSILPEICRADLIFTKAWAQATRVGCSMFVLQSGNHEFICIRHRRTQTLYISELIKPYACEEPSYGKIHVGLYVAAVMDTMDRERQMCNVQPPGVSDGPSGSGADKADSARSGCRDREHKGDRGDPRRGEGGEEPEGGGWSMQPKESDSGKKPKGGGTRRGRTVRSTAKKMAMTEHEMATKVCFVRCCDMHYASNCTY